MRVLHTGDLHLDLQTHSRPDPTTGLPSRLLDTGRCWRFACEAAVERGVELLVLAGDVFHGRNPSAAALNEFAAGLRILEADRIPVVAIPGNHDGATHPGQRSVLEAFHDGEFVHVATRPEVVSIGGLRVACLPWVSRAALMAANPGVMRTDAQQQLMDALARVLDLLRAGNADILLGHWSVEGSVLGGEVGLDLAITGDPALPPGSLLGFLYVAFAHIHRQQAIRVGDLEIGTYCGSIDRMNFGEEDYSPSVTLVDLEEHEAELIQTPARRFVTFELPGDATASLLTDPHWSWEDTGTPEEKGREVEGAIVRVRLSISEGVYAKLDREAIARGLYDAGAHQVRIEVDVERTRRPRAEHIAEAQGPLDALEQWIEASEIPEEERADLRLAAKELVT